MVTKNLEIGGYKPSHTRPLGALEMTIAVLTLIPATSFFGAILATGFMGGAIATHVRISDNFVVQP